MKPISLPPIIAFTAIFDKKYLIYSVNYRTRVKAMRDNTEKGEEMIAHWNFWKEEARLGLWPIYRLFLWQA